MRNAAKKLAPVVATLEQQWRRFGQGSWRTKADIRDNLASSYQKITIEVDIYVLLVTENKMVIRMTGHFNSH